ncbi:hypothetical protein GCM10012286_22370 [Streptomyces lasiicapitis]|uniref:Uncharacterized protein n=1 Tax=Streptomyces lasiicapitis TaxID=1923961 RepID=A0ABQ2LQI0_9ACTN|nr:hypothetical protein GCM10012286_22370 [Streptomyces lasiicapitis]
MLPFLSPVFPAFIEHRRAAAAQMPQGSPYVPDRPDCRGRVAPGVRWGTASLSKVPGRYAHRAARRSHTDVVRQARPVRHSCRCRVTSVGAVASPYRGRSDGSSLRRPGASL